MKMDNPIGTVTRVVLLHFLLLLPAPIQDAECQRMLVPMLPPPATAAAGGPNSLAAHLAKSPASIQLATDFFAAERLRASSNNNNNRDTTIDATSLTGPEPEVVFSGAVPSFRLDQYHSLDEIYAFLEAIPRRFGKRAQLFTIGRTSEGRPIKALELINNSTDPNYVWLDAVTHAREWVTGSTILYIIDQLLTGPSQQNSNNYNYLIVPVVNPDGYAYTWTTNRMWRKNRSRPAASNSLARGTQAAPAGAQAGSGGACVGADLNRNFDHRSFGGEGASQDPCSHIYSGPHPFSEPETRALADLLWSLRDRIKFYLTIHSYNQLWACPYAHTTDQSASYSKHMRVLRTIQRAVREAEGVQYEIGPLSTSLYVGSGFGIDFAYDKCGIEHSYLVELRDKGAHGFLLPADQIMPTARETYAGLRAGLKAALGPGGSSEKARFG